MLPRQACSNKFFRLVWKLRLLSCYLILFFYLHLSISFFFFLFGFSPLRWWWRPTVCSRVQLSPVVLFLDADCCSDKKVCFEYRYPCEPKLLPPFSYSTFRSEWLAGRMPRMTNVDNVWLLTAVSHSNSFRFWFIANRQSAAYIRDRIRQHCVPVPALSLLSSLVF